MKLPRLPAIMRLDLTRLGLAGMAFGLANVAHAQLTYATPATISTFAGTAGARGAIDGTRATFYFPEGIGVDRLSGNVYVVDSGNHTIRKITPAGVVSTFAGLAGTYGDANGPGSTARFFGPQGLTVDNNGNVYVADSGNSAIRKITPAGVVSLYAGVSRLAGAVDGPALSARFWGPARLVADAAGNIYVSDMENQLIRKISNTGIVSTLAGSAGSLGNVDGTGSAARFNRPQGIAVDANGFVYVADYSNHAIRRVSPTGVVTTLAGNLTGPRGHIDATGSAARFDFPVDLAMDLNGDLLVADTTSNLIRRVTPAGVVTTVAGQPYVAQDYGIRDGTGSDVLFGVPFGIAADGSGGFFVSDGHSGTIRRGVFRPVVTFSTTLPIASVGGSTTIAPTITSVVTPITYQWLKNDVLIPGATSATLTLNNVQLSDQAFYRVVVTNAHGSVTSESIPVVLRLPPVFTSQPVARTVDPGGSATFTATTAPGFIFPITYQWQKDGVNLPGATNTSLLMSNVQAAQLGTYTLVARNQFGSATSSPAALSFNLLATGRLTNLSIRTSAGTGAQTLIVGVVVGGASTSGTKAMLLRGVGPSLRGFGVTGFLADPALSVMSGTTIVTVNDNWGGDAQIATVGGRVGAFGLETASSRDAAIYQPSLPPANYTVQVAGVGGTTGIALAEIYDATPPTEFIVSTPRLINVSARTHVGTGENILIAGFTIGGSTPRNLLIRAIGPTLELFGVTGFLANPRLDVFSGSSIIYANDDWAGEPALLATSNSVGAFPLSATSRDAVVLVSLAPGSYTAQITGVAGTTGVALIEIYEAP
jgi:sugar lactone lactonase YvrE